MSESSPGEPVQIGELVRRTGVSERLLRYYEAQGCLLAPTRRASGYREYSPSDVFVVAHIRNLLAAGLSTATIADVLPCMGKDGERLIADCPELVDDLHRERERITASIHALEAARSTLDTIIVTAPLTRTRIATA